jgi:hypothetical protein
VGSHQNDELNVCKCKNSHGCDRVKGSGLTRWVNREIKVVLPDPFDCARDLVLMTE